MCPVCIAAAALIAGKATSTAGLTALGVKTWHRLHPGKHVAQPSACGEEGNRPASQPNTSVAKPGA